MPEEIKKDKPTEDKDTVKSQFNKIGLVDSQIEQVDAWLTDAKRAEVLAAKHCGKLRAILLEFKIAMKEKQDKKKD